MSLLHLVHVLAVGALLWGAAAAAEAGLRRLGLATRWVWAAALAATVAAPLWGPAVAGPVAGPDLAPGALGVPHLDASARAGGGLDTDLGKAGDSGILARLVGALVPGGEGLTASLGELGARTLGASAPVIRWAGLPRGWMPWAAAGGTALAALLLLGGVVHLHRRSRTWRTASWRERTVWLARDFGPAAVGLARPRPVLPLWALEFDEAEVELMVRHEEAHARAGDPALLLAGATLAVLAPWNPTVWVLLRRLRDAVEMDCDARVLRGGVSPSRYGRLLVEMRARGGTTALPTPALLDSPESLERRLTTMFTKKTTLAGALPALIGAGLLVVAACETPAPTSPDALAPETAGTITAEQVPADEEGLTVIEVEPSPDHPTPLIIVDGEPVEGSVRQLEALDIRSIEVVKGEAARATYGERGADGVVRVTTLEGEARELGIPVAALRERVEAEKAAARGAAGSLKPAEEGFTATELTERGLRGAGTVEAAGEPVVVEGVEILPDPSFEVRRGGPAGVVKVRPSTGTLRAEPSGEASPLEAIERSALYVSKTGALVVVDGEIRESWRDIDPRTVERIEVVKGEAATARYGARAANGAVVIRTTGGGAR